jgi:hypothetical protein
VDDDAARAGDLDADALGHGPAHGSGEPRGVPGDPRDRRQHPRPPVAHVGMHGEVARLGPRHKVGRQCRLGAGQGFFFIIIFFFFFFFFRGPNG